jgi:hypothetical protein
MGCDCNRRTWIERFYPDTTAATPGNSGPCGMEDVTITAFGIALAEGNVNHGMPYPNEVLTPR